MPNLSDSQRLVLTAAEGADGTLSTFEPTTLRARARSDLAADPVMEQIQALERLGVGELRARWAEAYGAPSPRRWNRALLVRGIAHRLQETALGGPVPALRRRLVRLAVALERDGGDQFFAAPRIKPGTRLIRQWHGVIHHVTVLEDGFDYRGERYRSLSGIARTITGARWSGPAFFGLKTRRRTDRQRHG